MTTAETIAAYRQAIADLNIMIGAGNNARSAIAELSRELDQIEAAIIVAGLEGQDESERKANLVLTLAVNADYQHVRLKLDEQKRAAAEYDRRAVIGKEECRLYRLMLLLAASPALLEAVA